MRGNARKFSDLDLAIINESPLDFATYAGLKDAFSDSDLPFKVDVVDWNNINEDFKKLIREHFVVVQRSK